MTQATNDIEIRVLGIMRSGNHAIIEWLHSIYPGRSICFLNNVRHGDHDPFKSCTHMLLTGLDESLDRETLRITPKDVIIYSYEDNTSLKTEGTDFYSSVFDNDFESKRDKYLGKSNHRFDIVIIRDPFNCFASRLTLLRSRGSLGGLTNMQLIKDNWKVLAKKALDAKGKRDCRKIVISYNRWVKDNAYQKELSIQLKGQISFNSLDDISPFGGGSSFQKTYRRKLTAKELLAKWRLTLSLKRWKRIDEYLKRLFMPKKTPDEFLTRWERLSNDQEFRELFNDRELLKLSEALFGEIPGTREFVKRVCGKAIH